MSTIPSLEHKENLRKTLPVQQEIRLSKVELGRAALDCGLQAYRNNLCVTSF